MNPNRPGRAGQVFAALGKSICYVGLFFGLQILVVIPPSFVIGFRAALEGWDEDAIYAAMAEIDVTALTLISGLLTLAVVMVFYLLRRKKLSEALWLRPVSAPTLFVGAALAPALYFAVVIVLTMLPASWRENYGEASADVATGTVVGVISVALVAPIVEEVIFRGLTMTRLNRAMPGWLAVLVSAAVFGACHGELVWICYAFVLGVFFAFIDLRAGSILPSILGHLMFNAIGQIMTFIPETEEGTEILIALGVLFAAAIVLPILDYKGIAALFRSRPAPSNPPAEWALPAASEKWALPAASEKWEPPSAPGTYEFDPWEE